MGNERWERLFAKTVTKPFITLRMRRLQRFMERAADNVSVILKKNNKSMRCKSRMLFC